MVFEAEAVVVLARVAELAGKELVGRISCYKDVV